MLNVQDDHFNNPAQCITTLCCILFHINICIVIKSVCDNTTNLNETESDFFLQIPNISDNESNTFLDTKYFPIPNPIIF